MISTKISNFQRNSYRPICLPELTKFKKNILITWRNYNTEENFTYEQIIDESEIVLEIFKSLQIEIRQKIAIILDHSPQIITVILSILNYCCSVCTLSENLLERDITKCLQDYGARYLLRDNAIQNPSLLGLELIKEFHILEKAAYLYEAEIKPLKGHSLLPLCFSIQTSGTTSKSKTVHVPFDCIVPNIESLSTIFTVSAKDVIFLASPLTFDPFFVDIFLALRNGASLLIVPKHIRQAVTHLPDIIIPTEGIGATILQITPSVFKEFGHEAISKIFSQNSSLRIISFGGEPFPDKDQLKTWQKWTKIKGKRIFNIYGITEVSCWSSLDEINYDTMEATLGIPLENSTILQVRNPINNELVSEGEGNLFIGSSVRKCLIDNEDPQLLLNGEVLFRATGDMVTVNKGKIIYKGRSDDIIKRFGHRVCLTKIEITSRRIACITNVCCTFWRKMNLLILFYMSAESNSDDNNIKKILKEKLENYEYPDHIIKLDSLPLSSHGKLSRHKLLLWYESRMQNKNDLQKPVNTFKALMSELAIISQEHIRNEENPPKKKKCLSWDCSFLFAGGTSLQALQLSNGMRNIIDENTNSRILPMLLDERCPLRSILSIIEATEAVFPSTSKTHTLSKKKDEILKVSWKYNLEKCVDANPSLLFKEKEIVSIGSHSHLLVNLNAKTGKVLSSLTLPDRIESQVVFLPNCSGVVGCYDGFIYNFELESGKLIWSFNSHGMIKCKPLIVADRIIFGNYTDADNLFCVDIEGRLRWSIKVGAKGIYSSPIALDSEKIVACTLDGTIFALYIESGNVYWQNRFNSPIFSTSSVLFKEYFLVAEVTGMVHCFNFQGDEVSIPLVTKGTIFSSFEVREYSKEVALALFGCHDCTLYCVEVSKGNISLKCKFKLQSEIFSTPKIVHHNNKIIIVSCTTNGFVNLIDLQTEMILSTFQLPGEIFSTPSIKDNLIFVGCRDNHLYCLEIINFNNVN